MTTFASASLYVGDLVIDVTEALLFEIFNAVGPVASVRVCRDAATRRSLGYAYVNFHRVEDAERAMELMNFKVIRGRPCRIMWSHRDPSLRKSGVGNIFVKNLAPSIDNKTLCDTFSMFGNILSCKVATNRKGESLGYGFVHYESHESAQNAIERVDGKSIGGEKVHVAPFKSKKERGVREQSFTNVFVKNLPEEWAKEKLDEVFSKCGNITSSVIVSDKDGKSRGFGFVNFSTTEEAEEAVQTLNNVEHDGKKLFVGRAQKKEEREKQLREQFEQLKVERHKKFAGVNLYVKNLADTITEDRLREEFAKFGAITSAKVMHDDKEKSRGFGFVCFSTPEEATKAVTEMNGRMLESKPLYVALAQRKQERRQQLEAQYARGRGGGADGKMGAMMMYPQGAAISGMVPPQMYPPQGMFFQGGGMPQRNMMYPQQMMPRRWTPAPAPHMMGRNVNYQLMPAGQQRGNGNNASPNNRNNRRNRKNQGNQQNQHQNGQAQGQQNVIYSDNVRNANAQGQADAPKPAEPATEETEAGPLTTSVLAAAPEDQRKQMIGERLFPMIREAQPELAGKITGMLLEMDNGELLHLLESHEALAEKIREAIIVLEAHTNTE